MPSSSRSPVTLPNSVVTPTCPVEIVRNAHETVATVSARISTTSPNRRARRGCRSTTIDASMSAGRSPGRAYSGIPALQCRRDALRRVSRPQSTGRCSCRARRRAGLLRRHLRPDPVQHRPRAAASRQSACRPTQLLSTRRPPAEHADDRDADRRDRCGASSAIERGRLSVLFGSIVMYSIANLAERPIVATRRRSTRRCASRRHRAGGRAGRGHHAGQRDHAAREPRLRDDARGRGRHLRRASWPSLVGDSFDWRTAYVVGGGDGDRAAGAAHRRPRIGDVRAGARRCRTSARPTSCSCSRRASAHSATSPAS